MRYTLPAAATTGKRRRERVSAAERAGQGDKVRSLIRDKAGITGKELTYHCSRHTAATLAISAGAELYSASKILGHRNLVSTQVYAKVNLEKKINAVNLFNGIFE